MIQLSRSSEEAVAISLGDLHCGLLRTYVVRPGNDGLSYPLHCRLTSLDDGAVWVDENGGVIAALRLKRQDAGYTGKFSAFGSGRAIVRLVWELPEEIRGFPFVPAFMYGRNEGGRSPWATYPQLCETDSADWSKPWIAQEWLVRTDRSSHGLTSILADEMIFALGGHDVCRYQDGTVAEKTGIGISGTRPHRISFSLGFANVPYTYSAAMGRNFFLRPEGYIDLDRGEVECPIFMLLFRPSGRQQGAARLLRESYALLHDEISDAGTVEEAIRAVSDALVRHMYCEKAHNFYLGLSDNPRMMHTLMGLFSTGWSGGVRTAYPLLVCGHQFGEAQWVKTARDVLGTIATKGRSERSGLFFENYNANTEEWSTHGWWYRLLEKPGHAGYINGQICYYLLLGYLCEERAGVRQREWLKAAAEVLDLVIDRQGEDGRFGYTYNETDGSILDPEGFSGCWFTPALALLYRIGGEKRHLLAAERAMDFYRRYVNDFNVWGGPLDTFKSPDQEGILAWIEAARLLHEMSREGQFLEDLLAGLDYEFSWKFAYNVVNEIEPLKSMNWCSTGGAVTSVNNSHIHPMGAVAANGILYAANLTGDAYLRSRLVDTVRWTLSAYLHYDGHYGWGKKGLINERFCYTDSLLLERLPDGSPASTWFFAHSWASGAVLEGLAGPILETAQNDPASVLGDEKREIGALR